MSNDIELLKAMSDVRYVTRYKSYINRDILTDEASVIIDDLESFFSKFKGLKRVDWEQFSEWFFTCQHPKLKMDSAKIFRAIFQRLDVAEDIEDSVAQEIVLSFMRMDYASRIRAVCDDVLDGTADENALDEVLELVDEFSAESGRADDDSLVVMSDPSALYDEVAGTSAGTLEWRTECLNQSVGPARPGAFMIVGARPESGKTSFLCSEATYMAEQLEPDDRILIINNEEAGRNIMMRLTQAALAYTNADLASHQKDLTSQYDAKLGGKEKVVLVSGSDLSMQRCEALVREINPRVVMINVLDKVVGTRKDVPDTQRLRDLGIWCRNMCINGDRTVIACMQAGGEANDQKWIGQHQLYGSKTGLQGEADVIITIGKLDEPTMARRRFIHVPKNKLPPGPKSVPGKRHGHFEVDFDEERCRYA